MSRVTRCDICGKVFGYGFDICVGIQGAAPFTNISEERFELGQKDVCLDCYYKAKRMLTNILGKEANGNADNITRRTD